MQQGELRKLRREQSDYLTKATVDVVNSQTTTLTQPQLNSRIVWFDTK